MAEFDDVLNRQPPQSLEAEQAVLGAMLIDSRCVADVSEGSKIRYGRRCYR